MDEGREDWQSLQVPCSSQYINIIDKPTMKNRKIAGFISARKYPIKK